MRRLIDMYYVSHNGEDWYTNEGPSQLKRIAKQHKIPYYVAAGVYAALSPNINSRECFTSTGYLLMQRHQKLLHSICGYKTNVVKALRIARGEEPLSVLSGLKVTAFYRALMGEDVLVVDVHVINAWRGTLAKVTEAKVSIKERSQLVRDYTFAAGVVGASIRSFQARVWNEQKHQRSIQNNPSQLILVNTE